MLHVVRDQENLVHGHQQAAASKPLNQGVRTLQPKTPGNKFPKTPLKIPLHDENAASGFGGKTGKGKGLDTGKKAAFATPMATQNRAPLGMKTTNAKAKAYQTPAGPAEKELNKTQVKPASNRRPKPKVSHTETVKLSVHEDEAGPLEERDVEYCPPKPDDLPYESDIFPDGCLSYDMITGPNLMKGWQQHYLNPKDADGVPFADKKFEEEYRKALQAGEEKICKAIEEDELAVADVPETFKAYHQKQAAEKTKKSTFTRGPATIASRKAASALSVAHDDPLASKSTKATNPVPTRAGPSFLVRGRKPVLSAPAVTRPVVSTMRHTAAVSTSRSTIGYTKGRSASTVLQQKRKPGLTRSPSNISALSDTTITPASYAEAEETETWKTSLLSIFDHDDDDLEPGLRGALPGCLRGDEEEEEEEFVMTLNV